MEQVNELLQYIRSLPINPLAAVIVAALLAAVLEQRVARRNAPDHNAAYRERYAYPNLPQRRRKVAKSDKPPPK
jgi:phosphate/sulfate permease